MRQETCWSFQVLRLTAAPPAPPVIVSVLVVSPAIEVAVTAAISVNKGGVAVAAAAIDRRASFVGKFAV